MATRRRTRGRSFDCFRFDFGPGSKTLAHLRPLQLDIACRTMVSRFLQFDARVDRLDWTLQLGESRYLGVCVETWRKELEAGHVDVAWADFIERYHRLIDVTIRRSLPEHDDALDAFAHVCERLSSCDLARLRKFSDRSVEGAKFSTWLVAVVRNLTVDFIRGRDGRPRTVPPPSLTELRRRIYHMVLLEHCSHIESYERLLAQGEKLSRRWSASGSDCVSCPVDHRAHFGCHLRRRR
jgi:hypothetical protein